MVSPLLHDLPDDPDTLKGVIEDLLVQLEGLARDKERLRLQLERLRQRLYGRKAEQTDPAQLLMFMDEILDAVGDDETGPAASDPVADPEDDDESSPTRPRAHGRSRLPDHLPRRRREIEPRPEDLVCDCCNQPRTRFGEAISSRLEYEPGSFVVIEEVRGKYSCAKCPKSVSTPPVPARPIEKGLAEPGLLAHVLVSKYGDHLPLERQSKIFARHGIELAPSTLMDWVTGCTTLLEPVYEAMRAQLLASDVLLTDDTPIRVLEHLAPGSHQGRLWTYISPGELGVTLYDFSPNWEGVHPQRFLRGFSGHLQSDGYAGYQKLFDLRSVISVLCNAHARRRFYDARSTDPVRAAIALSFYRRLYRIEKDCKGVSPDQRREARQLRAAPVMAKFKAWLDEQAPLVLPRSPLGEAIAYARDNWEALTRYLENGRLAIDNNAAERALRCITVGRANWLFAGSDEGGRRAAVIFSFIATCKQHGIEPFAYLRDVLARLPAHPPGRVHELTPVEWKKSRSPPVAAT